MPGDCNSGNTSPSLISVLRQYRFQKKESSKSPFCSSSIESKDFSGQPKPVEATKKPELVNPNTSNCPGQLKPAVGITKSKSVSDKSPKGYACSRQLTPEEATDKKEVVTPLSPKTPPSVSEVTFVPETPDSQRPDSKSAQPQTSQECPSEPSSQKFSPAISEKTTSSCLSSTPSQIDIPEKYPPSTPDIKSQTKTFPESPLPKPEKFTQTTPFQRLQSSVSALPSIQSSVKNGHCTTRLIAPEICIPEVRKTISRQINSEYRKRSQVKCSGSKTGTTQLELTSSQHRQLMDEYDIFSEKERSLRNLLEMYPGSDIMEVQDILVSCDWNLKLAIKVLKDKPLASGKKRGRDQSSVTEGKLQQKRGVVYDSDSTDSESQLRAPVKAEHSEVRKKRRIIISDDSDKEDGVDKSTVQKSSESVIPEKDEKDPSGKESEIGCTIHENSEKCNCGPETVKHETNCISELTNSSQECKPSENSNNQNTEIDIQKNNSADSCSIPESGKSSDLNSSISNTPSPSSSSSHKNESDFSDKQLSNQTIMYIRKTYSKNIAKKPKDVAEIMKETLAEIQKETAILQEEKVKNIREGLQQSLTETKSISFKRISSKQVPGNELSSRKRFFTGTRGSASVKASANEVSNRKKLPAKRGRPVERDNDSVRTKKKRIIRAVLDEEDDEEEYNNECLYDSDASDNDDGHLTPIRSSVMAFFQDATPEELLSVPGCSKKKAEMIVQCRPFKNWNDLVQKFDNSKYLSPDLLDGAKKVLDMRSAIRKLMLRCKSIADDMQDLVSDLLEETQKDEEDYVTVQPALLNSKLSLAHYQMVGLNWLVLMHKQRVNGILADEMGLGKTIQAIAFLAHLSEKGDDDLHLIVVPSSTLDNWKRELAHWCPSLSVLCYHGSQEERKELRMRILNDEIDFNILITTYNMVTSCPEDRGLFKRIEFHYVIFDEAHMLKNMGSQRYQNLMKIKAKRRLLLTGTPLQNNLVELMSLLIFVMPSMFSGKIDQVKLMFSSVSKAEENRSKFEQEQIEHAKNIMKPFVLRRLKKEVLKQLPTKHEETVRCPLPESQQKLYTDLVASLLKQVQEKDISTSGMGMMMQLRKAANHPLLLRGYYTDRKIKEMAALMLKEPTHHLADVNLVFEDMGVMSDFELHRLCKMYKSISSLRLEPSVITDSAKFQFLDKVLAECKEKGDRVLLFSQFTMMLDIMEEYLTIREYRYLRLDGTTPVTERQQLIDQFTEDTDIPIFLLSTRAGGLGINLTAANIVIQHDIDFNPYNDKQAEDRCHRVGQKKEVKVMKLISQNTIDENILQRATEKLRLERDITAEEEAPEEEDTGSVEKLLRAALSL